MTLYVHFVRKENLFVLCSLLNDWNYFLNKYCNWLMINYHIKGRYKTTYYKTNSNSSQFFISHWLLRKCFFESAKSRAWRACMPACFERLRAWRVCVLTYLCDWRAWRTRVFDALPCSRAWRALVFACLAYVLAMMRAWRA